MTSNRNTLLLLFTFTVLMVLVIPCAAATDTEYNCTPAEDGYIKKNVDVYIRYNNTNQLQIGPSAGKIYRCYIEWDISSFPNATIIDLVFYYDGNQNLNNCTIGGITNRPHTTADNTIYWNIGNGTVYADPPGFPIVGDQQVVDLNGDAVASLQAAITAEQPWWAIGIMSEDEVSGALSMIEATENPASPNPVPTLYVSFSGNYRYTFNGGFYENCTSYGGVDVSYSNPTGSGEFKVDGPTTKQFFEEPALFYWDVGEGYSRRIYSIGEENISIFMPEDVFGAYGFTVRDYTGQLGQANAYLESLRIINGTNQLIERMFIQDTANTIPLTLVKYKIYTLRVRFIDDTIYTFGTFIPGVETTPTLSIYDIDSSEQLHYIGEDITVEFSRPTYGNIQIDYEDTAEKTTSIFVEVCHLNGTQVWNDTSTDTTKQFNWDEAVSSTDYLVNLVAQHPEVGEVYASTWLTGLKPDFDAPPDFDAMLGEGASTAFAVFMIFAAYLLFSRATALLGIFFATSMTYIMIYLGFLDMTYTPVHVTMGLVVMWGLGGGSNR